MKALRKTYLEILAILARNGQTTPKQIIQILAEKAIKQRRQELNDKLGRLLKKQYVSKRQVGVLVQYSLTALGAKEFARALTDNQKNLLRSPSMKPPNKRSGRSRTGHLAEKEEAQYQAKRFEAYKFSYPIVQHDIGHEDKVILVRATGLPFGIEPGLKNQELIMIRFDVLARLTSNYLTLYVPKQSFPPGTISLEAEARLREQMDKYAEKLEIRLNQAREKLWKVQHRRGLFRPFELTRMDGHLLCEIEDSEVAEEEHKAAKAAKATGRAYKVYNPRTGKLRMKLPDLSNPKGPEAEFFEATGQGTGEDSDNWDVYLNHILDGKIPKDIRKLKEVSIRMAEEISAQKSDIEAQKEDKRTLNAILERLLASQEELRAKDIKSDLDILNKRRTWT